MPTPKTQRSMEVPTGLLSKGPSPVGVPSPMTERSARGSVSNENNILLDPEILTDYPTQALVLTVLVSASTLLIFIVFLISGFTPALMTCLL